MVNQVLCIIFLQQCYYSNENIRLVYTRKSAQCALKSSDLSQLHGTKQKTDEQKTKNLSCNYEKCEKPKLSVNLKAIRSAPAGFIIYDGDELCLE